MSIIVQICGNNRHFSVCLAVCYQPTLFACYIIKLGWQSDMVDFALSNVVQSIGVVRCTFYDYCQIQNRTAN